MEKHPMMDELARVDAAISALSSEIQKLEDRLRAGDKVAFRTAKYRRGELLDLRQERVDLEKRLRRFGMRVAA